MLFDLSQGEGVAYRGRILVELSTQLDGKVDKNVDDISSDDILVAQVQAVQHFYLMLENDFPGLLFNRKHEGVLKPDFWIQN